MTLFQCLPVFFQIYPSSQNKFSDCSYQLWILMASAVVELNVGGIFYTTTLNTLTKVVNDYLTLS